MQLLCISFLIIYIYKLFFHFNFNHKYSTASTVAALCDGTLIWWRLLLLDSIRVLNWIDLIWNSLIWIKFVCQFSNPVFFCCKYVMTGKMYWLIDIFTYGTFVCVLRCLWIARVSIGGWSAQCDNYQSLGFSSPSTRFVGGRWHQVHLLSSNATPSMNEPVLGISIPEFQLMFESDDDLTMSWLAFQLSASGMRCNFDSKTFTFHIILKHVYGKYEIVPPPLNKVPSDKL